MASTKIRKRKLFHKVLLDCELKIIFVKFEKYMKNFGITPKYAKRKLFNKIVLECDLAINIFMGVQFYGNKIIFFLHYGTGCN